MRQFYRHFLVCLSLLILLTPSFYGQTATLQSGKAGVYARLGANPLKANAQDVTTFQANPLVDAVFLTYPWSAVEPEKGQFNMRALQENMKDWEAAGKHVILQVALYGEDYIVGDTLTDCGSFKAVQEAMTPAWVLEQPDVQHVCFLGGGVAANRPVFVPVVWNTAFVSAYIAPLIEQLGKTFDGDPGIWYVTPGFGHLGNVTAQPSADGGKAFLAAGWMPAIWQAYCEQVFNLYQQAFPHTPLIGIGEGVLIPDPKHKNYTDDENQIIQDLARQGMSLIQFNESKDDLPWDKDMLAPIYQTIQPLLSQAWQGTLRLGLGDDWPIWVPEARRTQEPTVGHDDAYYAQALSAIFGGSTVQTPNLPTTIYFANPPEILASAPGSKDYVQQVHDTLQAARDHLLKTDSKITLNSTSTVTP